MNTPFNKYFLYATIVAVFTPFVVYLPGFSGEYQPFFLIFGILFLATTNNAAIGSIGTIHNTRLKASLVIAAIFCFICLLEIYSDQSESSAATYFRFLNLTIMGFILLSEDFMSACADRRGPLFWVILSYSLFGTVQLAGLAPANLPFVNRSTAEIGDLLDTGRGVPAFATEPSTFGGVVVALVITHWLCCHFTSRKVSWWILILSGYCFFVLSKSTVYMVFFFLAATLALIPVVVSRPMKSLAAVIIMIPAVIALLPYLQPRTYDLLLAISEAPDPIGLIESISTLGARSFSYRITPILGVPYFSALDFLQTRSDTCYPYLFIEFFCINDGSSITGFYVLGYSIPKFIAPIIFAGILFQTLRAYATRNPVFIFICWTSLLSFLHVSGNSPFFPIYFWLCFLAPSHNAFFKSDANFPGKAL